MVDKVKWTIVTLMVGLQFSVKALSCHELISQANRLQQFDSAIADLRDIENHFMLNLPGARTQVIAIGQSPSVISAYLKSQNSEYVQNIPLSNFRPLIEAQGLNGSSAIINSRVHPNSGFLTKPQIQKLFRHFDRFLKLDSNKDIAVSDYSSSGATLLGIYFYLKLYLTERGMNNRVVLYCFVGRNYYNTVIAHLRSNLTAMGYFNQANTFYTFLLQPKLGQFIWDHKAPDQWSEFGSYSIDQPNEASNSSRPAFNDLVRYFRSHNSIVRD